MSIPESLVLDEKTLASQLQQGSAALFPTDTLPALCSCPSYASKIWETKKRPINKPLILMGGCIEDLFEVVKPCAVEDGLKMAKIYWPGALTIILPTIGNFSKNTSRVGALER